MASPRLKLLSTEDRAAVQQRVWAVLSEVGVVFRSAQARKALAIAGCRVASDSPRVRIPVEVLDHVADLLPGDVLLAARDPRHDVVLDGTGTCFSSTGVSPHVLDDESGRRREPGLGDVDAFTRLQDALDAVGIVSQVLSPSADLEGSADLTALEVMIHATSKHLLLQILDPRDAEIAVEVARIAAPDADRSPRVVVSNIYCPVAPLQHEALASETAMQLSAAGVPVVIWSGCVAGVTSPPTLAGTIIQNLCDELSAAVLLKSINPACPLVLGAHSGVMDMRSGRFIGVSPEVALMAVAEVEMAHEFGVPALALASVANSWGSGVDAGLDATWALPAVLSGADLAVGLGMVQGGQGASLAKLLIDAEMAGGMQRMLDGLRLDEVGASVEVLRSVGPGGHYLSHRETRRVSRTSEVRMADVLGTSTYEEWASGGGDAWARARIRVRQVLEEHRALPLPDGAAEQIRDLVRRR